MEVSQGGHRGGQVDQPAGVHREAAEGLDGRGAVRGHPHVPVQARVNVAFTHQIREVQHVVGLVLGAAGAAGAQGLDRGVVDPVGRHAQHLALGVAQGRELAAEAAAGVDVEGAVEPLGLQHRDVAVHHRGGAAVVQGPVGPHRQAELVDLAGGLAVEGEGADRPRGAPLVGLFQAGVGDHEAPLVQHVVGHQPIEEVQDSGLELLGSGLQAGDGGVEAVGELNRATLEQPDEAGLVVAVDAEGLAAGDEVHHQGQDLGGLGTPVHEVSHEHELAVRGAPGGESTLFLGDLPPQVSEQLQELVEAAVDVADDVEGAALVAQVVVEAGALDSLHLVGAAQDLDDAEALGGQAADGAPHRGALGADDVRRHDALAASGVVGLAEALRDIQDDRRGEDVKLPGQGHQGLAQLRADVGGVHDGEQAPLQALAHDEVQHLKGGGGGGLVVGVVADQAAAEVRGHHLGGLEESGRQGALPRTRGSDEHHEAELGNFQSHR